MNPFMKSTIPSCSNFLEEILKRLETWLAELEVLLDRRIERPGVLRGVSELSSLMCGLVLEAFESDFLEYHGELFEDPNP